MSLARPSWEEALGGVFVLDYGIAEQAIKLLWPLHMPLLFLKPLKKEQDGGLYMEQNTYTVLERG